MTALPKRKPARRTTMAEPEPAADRCVLCGEPVPPPVLPPFADDYRACADIKACTSRMPRGEVPGQGTPGAGTALLPIFTPAMRAEADAYRDQLRTDWGLDGIGAFNDDSEAEARRATYRPCSHPYLRAGAASPPVMMP